VDETARSAREHIAAILRGRSSLVEQIKQSRQMIERSQELLKRIDDLLARAGEKP
jgi:hypothetical protein